MAAPKKKSTTKPTKAKSAGAKSSATASKTAASAKSKEAATKTPAGAAKAKAPTKPKTTGAPATIAAQPTVVDAPTAVIVGPVMRKKEIIDEVVLRSGLKKRDVKPVLDSILAVMGDAIGEGREMVLQPFGRLKVHRQKTTPKKKIFFAKVHQNAAPSISGPKMDTAPDD